MTVLVASSAATVLTLRNGRALRTGYWLADLALPLEAIARAGHALMVATPGGVPPTPDPRSLAVLPAAERARLLAVVGSFPGLRRPVALESLGPDALGACDALLVPGGLAQLAGLSASEAMGRVLRSLHRQGAPTFAIGHGPAALLSTALGGEAFPYAGYAVTCFPSRLEHLLEFPLPVLRGRLPWHLDERLAWAGACVRHGALPGVPFLVEDRELVTAQDPFAARALARRIGERLGGGNA